ncbi:MAG: MerR family transcriptional regulator [Actinomycetes bacterium]
MALIRDDWLVNAAVDLAALLDQGCTVAAVARKLGVAPATLRTWDRRYGLGPSEHQMGQHRRYNAVDVARLTLMRKLVISGLPAASAAEAALRVSSTAVVQEIFEEVTSPATLAGKVSVEQLLAAARSFDEAFMELAIRKSVQDFGVIATWDELLAPVLTHIGNEWQRLGTGIEVEHLLTELIKRVLSEGVSRLGVPINQRPVLLACVGEEIHSLPLRALEAALAERQIDSRFMGARTPQIAINEFVRRCAPPAIFLWAQIESNGDTSFIHDLPVVRPKSRVLVGGPGWRDISEDCAVQSFSLADAVAEISRAVGI